jgi:RNA polymerase sigma-70 factor (ECF subfamily)
MSPDPLQVLLEQLSQGDTKAAEQIFLTYEPYLRKVVRRLLPDQLRARFDSIDVVQSVWTDLLGRVGDADWRFPDAAHLQAFLVKVTRNRFLDRVRQHQASLNRERAVPEKGQPAPQPRPSEIVQADELWDRMLKLCPPAHRDVLHLKRQGLSLVEIAAKTGLHQDSVRRILRTLAKQMALREGLQGDSSE